MLASTLLTVLAAVAPFVAVAAPVSGAEGLSTLEERAIYKPCKDTSVCGNMRIVSNSHHTCHKGFCDWACNSGYYRSDNKCHKSASQPAKTTTAASSWSTKQASTSNNNQLAATSNNALTASGVNKFLGTNTGAIASWFHTNSAQDSTNGHSWCWFPYNDNTPGFAISLNTMMADANWDATAARKKYCGLEAVVTTPAGKELTLYVTDAFDDTWVRTPTSIDVVYNAFSKLLGYATNNKNDVIQNVSWRFTGNRNEQYKYNDTLAPLAVIGAAREV
ncbi:hypothetical protein DMC30DRAFT_413396 [Rhodotorula diobovata]|uniref:Concanavalin A-like lectin/glucanase domain-containing protein n=1 Tax=Rhodotorula diobovata TaxID=5288 RepID=A0A5C5G6Z9_9BASI|nr:hypothetical protein DMC30DRAFT_413396 [Rhodotorula diobovata]